jgi:hypothetical protein
MNTLIIHPADKTTEFLLPIQVAVETKTVVRRGMNMSSIAAMVMQHDRFIGMGHGTPWGLMSVGQFKGPDFYIVDRSFVEMLRSRSSNIFIWCYAYEFAKTFDIPSFSTNMFISELREAQYMGIKNTTIDQVEESNMVFVKEISKCIDLPAKEIYESLMKSEYANLSQKNEVAAYNFERLHYINLN